MTTYNTGNPLGSSDPRDLYDNAENLDNFVNGAQPAYDDRLGQSRKSWAGMESEFAAFIASSGYEFVGDYAPGIELTGYQQILRDASGEFWRLSGSTTLPYTTTGAGLPEGGAFVPVGDAVLRQDLSGNPSDGEGAALVNGATIYVGSVAELEELPATTDGQIAYIAGRSTAGDGGQGLFVWADGDLSAQVTADAKQGVYVAPASDPTGVSGAWVRQVSRPIVADYFGSDLDSIEGVSSGEIALLSGNYTGGESVVNSDSFRFSAVGNDVTVNGLPLNKSRFRGVIEAPAAFGWNPPMLITKLGDNYRADIDLEKFEKASKGPDTITYYVDVNNGSTGNDGLTPDTPLSSIGAIGAIGEGNAAGVGNIVIKVAPGIYSRVDGWVGAAFNGNITVICEEGVYITVAERFSDLNWVSEANGVYSAVRSGVRTRHGIIDLGVFDKYGKPEHYPPVASVSEVEETPGSYYRTSTAVYVKTLDGRAPDENLLVILPFLNGAMADGDYTLFVKGGHFIGGDLGAFQTGTGAGAVAVFDGCEFSGSAATSGLVSLNTGLTISRNCRSYKNILDGFNYHDYSGFGTKAIEVDCMAWDNGAGKAFEESENSNGSSAHESIKIVRVNTLAWNSRGPNIADVNSSKSWNIGCKAWDSLALQSGQKSDFLFSGDTSLLAWLEGCEGGLTGIQVLSSSDTTVSVKDWHGGLVVWGPLGTY